MVCAVAMGDSKLGLNRAANPRRRCWTCDKIRCGFRPLESLFTRGICGKVEAACWRVLSCPCRAYAGQVMKRGAPRRAKAAIIKALSRMSGRALTFPICTERCTMFRKARDKQWAGWSLIRSAYPSGSGYGLKGSGAVRADAGGTIGNCGAVGSLSVKADGDSRVTHALSPAAMPGAPKRMKHPTRMVTARRTGTRPVRSA